MTLLVTTALESTWGDGEPLLFLGEWCRLYERGATWRARQHEVVPYHWHDRAKLARDYEYLAGLHEKMLGAFADLLGERHRLQRPLRYWRTLLDPWLMTWVAVVFDRWECLRMAFERHADLETLALPVGGIATAPRGYDDFNAHIISDEWNHQLCLDILAAQYPTRCRLKTGRTADPERAWIERLPVLTRGRMSRVLDRLAAIWPAPLRVMFFQSYFPPRALTRLNFGLGQVPRLFLHEFENDPGAPPAAPRRTPLSLPLQPANDFERFLFTRAFLDVPSAWVEDFSRLIARASAIRVRPRVILTASAHWGNELFKLWAAERVQQGAELLTMEHGGSIPPRFDTMWFEEQIADAKITWAKPFRSRQVRLPPNKLAGKKELAGVPGSICLAIGYESWRYSHRATAYPMGTQVLEHLDLVCRFAEALPTEPRAAFRVKPFRNQGWNTRQRYIDRLGAAAVSDEPNLYRLLPETRIVLCTYPNTTYSEAMASGRPAVLLYPREHFETIADFDGLLAELLDARLLFYEPGPAAEHVARIWRDPLEWWNGAVALRARRRFRAEALDAGPDWLGKWRRFLGARLDESRRKGIP